MKLDFEVTGKPNEQGMNMLYEAVAQWVIAGRPTFTCKECRAALQTEAERKDGFCKAHTHTRKEFTHEDALRSLEKARRRRKNITQGKTRVSK
jgi:hypothetical protein